MALVAETAAGNGSESPGIIGVGRLTKIAATNDAEFAILVSDKYQHKGLGSELLSRLVRIGEDEGLSHIVADVLRDNIGMQRVCARLGFDSVRGDDGNDPTLKVVKTLE